MKKWRHAGWLGVFLLLTFPALALGGGFAINEHGTKAVGMGGAFVAQADDPTAVFYNPAGIVQLDGTQVSTGFSIIHPDANFRNTTTNPVLNGFLGTQTNKVTPVEEQNFFVPNAYVTYKHNDQVSFGAGAFSNFGLATEWNPNWEGRYFFGGVESKITTVSFNPVVAYRPVNWISFAVGPVLQYADITLKSKVIDPGTFADSNLKFEDDEWAWGFNAGLLIWLHPSVKFGASYRSEIKQEFSNGSVEFSPEVMTFYQNTTFEADITLPQSTFLGLSWDIADLTLEFDAQWTGWSSYDQLGATLSDPILVGGAMVTTISVPKDWNDVWAYRFGAQYKMNRYWDMRAGIIYDETPIPDATVDVSIPSGNRWLYTVGTSVHYKRWTADLAYNYLDDEGRVFNNPAGILALGQVTGKFEDVDAHITMFNLSYRF